MILKVEGSIPFHQPNNKEWMNKEFEKRGYKVININLGYEDLLVKTFEEAVRYNKAHGGGGTRGARGRGTGEPGPANFVTTPSLNMYMEYLASIVHREYLTSIVEKEIDLKLIPTYCYTRKYFQGSGLTSHIDRPHNEISLTYCISGPEWEISMGENILTTKMGKAIIYKGCEILHGRSKPSPGTVILIFCGWVISDGTKLSSAYDDGENKDFYLGD